VTAKSGFCNECSEPTGDLPGVLWSPAGVTFEPDECLQIRIIESLGRLVALTGEPYQAGATFGKLCSLLSPERGLPRKFRRI
jgi:hypothetical protein